MGNGVYDMVLRPEGKSVVYSILIYKNKCTNQGLWFVSERIDYGMTYSIDQTHFFSRSIYQAKNHLYRICFVRAQKGPIENHIQVLEEKLARLTQRVPTLRIDHIPAIMQELGVGIPLVWIRLMR